MRNGGPSAAILGTLPTAATGLGSTGESSEEGLSSRTGAGRSTCTTWIIAMASIAAAHHAASPEVAMKGRRAVRRRAEGLVLSALLLAGGCYRYGMRPLTESESAIVQHAIFIDNDGRPLLPSTTERARSTPGKIVEVTDDTVIVRPDTIYERYVGNIMAGIRADSARRRKAPRLLLRVHGGLNSLDESLDATMKMTKPTAPFA